MTVSTAEQPSPVDLLSRTYLLNYPGEAARHIETIDLDDVAEILNAQPAHALIPVWTRLAPSVADRLIRKLSDDCAGSLLANLDAGPAASLMARAEPIVRDRLLGLLDPAVADELKQLMEFPVDTAGRLMDSRVTAFHEQTRVGTAIDQMRKARLEAVTHLFLLDDDARLSALVDVQRLALADSGVTLKSIASPVIAAVNGLEPISEVIAIAEQHKVTTLPVIDGNDRVIGVIRSSRLMQALKEDLAADIQKMVGVSGDERALSSSLLACRKRLPWLEINLLTAFLAAAVVGYFEDTIAQFTALAVLLPVVAGQSGNAGAQALAVTMRGLTLREITMRHWLRVAFKEFGAGVLNGAAIAVTCAIGVYLWSRSVGLSMIIAVAMVISMTIAGIAGALVPIGLKRFGLDPAQSSSIVLTTVTDIAGFMSFLGIATALSGMLVPG